MREDIERKLKRERVEACLNCKKFVGCENIGKFEECDEFIEAEGEAWMITKFKSGCRCLVNL